jgi:hypothetical protein
MVRRAHTMKKFIFGIFGGVVAVSLAIALSGCYTQLATTDEGYDQENESAYAPVESDTTVDTTSGSTVINNYFGDDAYRDWRFNSSFMYYYPSYPWWDNDYWYEPTFGLAIFPGSYWWYGRNWYPPYWYFPSYSFYGNYGGGAYYHNYRGYGYGGLGRIRTGGSSRGYDDSRSYGVVGARGSASAVAVSGRTRDQVAPRTASAVSSNTQRQRAETPWWVRLQQDQVSGKSNATTQQANGSSGKTVRHQASSGRSVRGTNYRGRRYVSRGHQSYSAPRQGTYHSSPRTSSAGGSGGRGYSGGGHGGGGERGGGGGGGRRR